MLINEVSSKQEVFASTGEDVDKKKPLIIFIHGSGLSHITGLQTRYFAFHGYSVLAIDLPGRVSEGPALDLLKTRQISLDVIDSVDERGVIIGHSRCLLP